MNRCDSGTDSTVWMEEDLHGFFVFSSRPEWILRAYFVYEVTHMNGLLQQILDNLSFVIVCLLIVTALAVLAKFSETHFPDKRTVSKARYISIVGICAAIATVLHVLDFPLQFIAPEYYKLDFSELPILLCGFYLGPIATVACAGVKILL